MTTDVFTIAVCVHPVLAVDHSAPPELDARGQVKEELLQRSINERDLLALEEALRIRESLDRPIRIYAIHYGGESADEHLRSCLAMGADEALRITRTVAGPMDATLVAAFLAEGLGSIAPQLILCGDHSTEGMSGMVGPSIAHFLGIPYVGATVSLELALAPRRMRATQRFDRGARLIWDRPLPAVCGVDLGINHPRYVPVRRLIRSRGRAVKVVELAEQEHIGEKIEQRFGDVYAPSLSYPRVRPKKVAVAVSSNPADRLKAMRAVAPVKATGKSERLRGDPLMIARRIVELLEEKGLVE
jgi:electron transfer flavoprotein beta subunit